MKKNKAPNKKDTELEILKLKGATLDIIGEQERFRVIYKNLETRKQSLVKELRDLEKSKT